MKWIGQHIYDLISRFRSDVYLEDISTGTIASGGNLGLDSNNKIVKATAKSDCFDFKGYGTTDGTNYERQQIMTDNKAPFLHSASSGTDGLTALEHYDVLRLGAHVMPRAGVLTKWQGWASSAGSGTIDMSIVKVTPVANTTDDVTPVLVTTTRFTAIGNNKVTEIDEDSFSVAFAEGDMLYTVVLGSTASKLWYLSSTVEVEWT